MYELVEVRHGIFPFRREIGDIKADCPDLVTDAFLLGGVGEQFFADQLANGLAFSGGEVGFPFHFPNDLFFVDLRWLGDQDPVRGKRDAFWLGTAGILV